MIKLYYIPGIAESDTLITGDVNDVERYVEHYKVAEYDDGFYPPYYRNAIELPIEIESEYNYLSLEFQGRTYFYFIKSIDYINETDVSLNVEMDTIATFYYDIVLQPSTIVERKFINPGTIGNINRDYIRENVSAGDFKLKDKFTFSDDVVFAQYDDAGDSGGITGYLVFKLKESPNKDAWHNLDENPDATQKMIGEGPKTLTTIGARESTVISQFVYMMLPIIEGFTPWDPITIDWNAQDYGPNARPGVDSGKYPGGFTLYESIYHLVRVVQCVEAFYIPGNVLGSQNVRYDSVNGLLTVWNTETNVVTHPSQGYAVNDPVAYAVVLRANVNIRTYIERQRVNMGDYINAWAGSNNPDRLALLDENYIRITWGNNFKQSAMPLYNSKKLNQLDLLRYCSLEDGATYYWFYDNDPNLYMYVLPDKYTTLVSCPSVPYSIITDAWTEYVTYNKLSIIGSLAASTIAVAGAFVTGGTSVGLATTLISGVTHAVTARQTAHNGTLYTTKNASKNLNTSRRYESHKGGYGMRALSSAVNNVFAIANNAFQPDTVKAYGEYADNFYSNNTKSTYWIYVVNDFDACVNYYRMNGYLINKPLTSPATLDDFMTRRRFGVIKTAGTLLKLGVPDEIRYNIIDRLEGGVRIWKPLDNGSYVDIGVGFDNNTVI